jgi:hypothetical protein
MLRRDGGGRRRSLIPTVATIIGIALLGRWLLWRQRASGPAAPTATKSPGARRLRCSFEDLSAKIDHLNLVATTVPVSRDPIRCLGIMLDPGLTVTHQIEVLGGKLRPLANALRWLSCRFWLKRSLWYGAGVGRRTGSYYYRDTACNKLDIDVAYHSGIKAGAYYDARFHERHESLQRTRRMRRERLFLPVRKSRRAVRPTGSSMVARHIRRTQERPHCHRLARTPEGTRGRPALPAVGVREDDLERAL